MKTFMIEMDEYEVANLKEAIVAMGYPAQFNLPRCPLGVLNTGDWLGQLYCKLPDVDFEPNTKALDLVENSYDVRKWA